MTLRCPQAVKRAWKSRLSRRTVDRMADPTTLDKVARQRLRREKVERLARSQDGVVSRQQVYALGIHRGEVRAQVRAQRWRKVGRHSLCTHRGPLLLEARHRIAVIEGGPRAFLDGGSALIAAGLKGFTMDEVRVSVPRGARIWRARGADIRQTRRWRRDDVVASDPPRARVSVAAIRAALWARSDRQAALVLSMVVQQRLATAEELGLEMLKVRGDKRRLFVHGVILDLIGGVRSLGELDVARECRKRGLPEPTRQVLRRGRNGTYYLDIYWDQWQVVVEVDGIHHLAPTSVVGDALRQNDLAIGDLKVLRLPLLGLRVAADDFFAQIEEALVSRGWRAPGMRTG
jgi:very-short-patch-repair endonuclease